MTVLSPRSAAELREVLRARPGRLRLVGGGSRQDRLAPAPDAVRLRLDGLRCIARLDAPDQTCSVDCGVPREELDAALAAVGLELPCPGGGTLGGLFAADPIGAATSGGQSPRSLLLGIEAMLADGTPFKTGARVVKSVAGFDVHKLFVGSRGRLFVATRLHLRCKPRPRAEEWFAEADLAAAQAVALAQELRALAVPPAALQMARQPAGAFVVRGRLAGRPSFVAGTLRAHGLTPCAPCWQDHVAPPAGGEVVAGLALPSALPRLLPHVPAGAPFLWHGGGRFEAGLASAAHADGLLAAMQPLHLHGAIVRPASPGQWREAGTPVDPGNRQLEDGLRRALDPDGILA